MLSISLSLKMLASFQLSTPLLSASKVRGGQK
jgi:hypothetical protein